MQLVRDTWESIAALWAEWGDLYLDRLIFSQQSVAQQLLIALIGLAAIFVVIRSFGGRNPANRRMALPAIVSKPGWSRASLSRHGALMLALAGLPFFVLALSDPRTTLTRSETTFPGRRIALLIDASSSMLSALPSSTLAKGAPNNAAFFTTVGAARYFIERRMAGKFRDLMALVEFGDDAYVITPFTTDYENILLSTTLIGDWNEFMAFPDQGTVVAKAVEQAVGLFQAFDYLDAAGNLMVIFTDGQDSQAMLQDTSLDKIMAGARKNKIPVYMIRMAYSKSMGDLLPDDMWKSAIERTGGRFYAAANEETIYRAVREIDQLAPGRIDVREYSTRKPRFAGYTLIAVSCWLTAVLLKLGMRSFRTFP